MSGQVSRGQAGDYPSDVTTNIHFIKEWTFGPGDIATHPKPEKEKKNRAYENDKEMGEMLMVKCSL